MAVRSSIGGAMLVTLMLTSVAVVRPHASVSAAEAQSSRFIAVAPCRLVDTRTHQGYTRLNARTIRVSTVGRCGIDELPSALALSVVAVEPSLPGYLAVTPGGSSLEPTSTLNYRPGQIRSNSTISRVAADGTFDVYSTSGDVVVDVNGYFVPTIANRAGRFTAVTPDRILDTRSGPPIPPGGTVVIPLPAGVPADALALALSLTVTESDAAGFVTTYPTGSVRPEASALNVDAASQTRAGGGIHAVGPGGLTIFMSGGGHLIVDFTGWFTGPSASLSSIGLFTAVDPHRLLDTRLVSPLGTNVPVEPGGTVTIPSVDRATMAFNLTSVDGDQGFVTAFPARADRPTASMINPAGGGDIVASFGIVATGADGLTIFSQRRTHLVVDLAGWFSTVEPGRVDVAPPVATTTTTTLPPTTTTTTTTLPPTTTSTTTTTTTTTTTLPPTTTTPGPTTTVPVSERGIVYLTFDDGPNPELTEPMLDMLVSHGVTATFFLVGTEVAQFPEVAEMIVERGFAVGNHTFDHPDLRTLTDAQIRAQLRDAQDAIHAATGRRPDCMRPPFGYTDLTNGPPVLPFNPDVESVIHGAGYAIEQWTHDTNDWRTDATVASILEVLNQLPTEQGAVSNVLMHDWQGITVTAVDQWLTANASRYDFRVVPSC
jgi:peptidoglycan/xylan/chitin deacetylase (PgdA/CDA1 family)